MVATAFPPQLMKQSTGSSSAQQELISWDPRPVQSAQTAEAQPGRFVWLVSVLISRYLVCCQDLLDFVGAQVWTKVTHSENIVCWNPTTWDSSVKRNPWPWTVAVHNATIAVIEKRMLTDCIAFLVPGWIDRRERGVIFNDQFTFVCRRGWRRCQAFKLLPSCIPEALRSRLRRHGGIDSVGAFSSLLDLGKAW